MIVKTYTAKERQTLLERTAGFFSEGYVSATITFTREDGITFGVMLNNDGSNLNEIHQALVAVIGKGL